MGEPKRGHGVVLSSFVLSSFEGYAEEIVLVMHPGMPRGEGRAGAVAILNLHPQHRDVLDAGVRILGYTNAEPI